MSKNDKPQNDLSQIVIRRENHLGIITLNRPEALNALNLFMVTIIKETLIKWLDDEAVECVLLTSSSLRAFCAGGDVREAVSLIKDNPTLFAEPYFEAEYGLDLILTNYPKPVIALVDGIVMGGGLGLARLSKYMVISKTIKCAMPETAIGLFPDVGASKFLRVLPEPACLMMGMTGTILGAGDVIRWGLADYMIAADKFKALIEELASADKLSKTVIEESLARYQGQSMPDGYFYAHLDLITSIFGQDTPQAIAKAALKNAKQEGETANIAAGWAEALTHKSPTSIALFWAMIKHLDNPLNLTEAVQRDFHLACKMMRRPDFMEGVRAVLIDKDNAPQWQPASLDEVDDDLLSSICDFTDMPLLPLPSFILKTNND